MFLFPHFSESNDSMGGLQSIQSNSSSIGSTQIGKSVDEDLVKELRSIAFGSRMSWLSRDWIKASFVFRNSDDDEKFDYTLKASRDGTRGLIMCVQAQLFKNCIEENLLRCQNLKKPKKKFDDKNEMLARTMADILWRIGVSDPACECLRSAKRLKNVTQQRLGDGNNTPVEAAIVAHPSQTSRIANREFADNEPKPTVERLHPVASGSSLHPVASNESSATLVGDSSTTVNGCSASSLEVVPAVVKLVRPTRRPVHVSTSCYRTTFGCGAKDFITENLDIYGFSDYEALKEYLLNNLHCYTEPGKGGCTMFLYSIILTRGFDRLFMDNNNDDLTLLGSMEQLTIPLINLVLTGRAVEFLHDGVKEINEHGDLMDRPEIGINDRSDVGILYYDNRVENQHIEIGTRYRTPKCPVWVTAINGNHFGVLCCPVSGNNDQNDIGIDGKKIYRLISDWRAEQWFKLYYVNGIAENEPSRISIDTATNQYVPTNKSDSRKHQRTMPFLNRCIETKWPNCGIKWDLSAPYY